MRAKIRTHQEPSEGLISFSLHSSSSLILLWFYGVRSLLGWFHYNFIMDSGWNEITSLFFLLLLRFLFIYVFCFLNQIESNDFKSICMLIIWVQWFLNLIETLFWFYLETFMWLNEFLPIIENLLRLKVFTLSQPESRRDNEPKEKTSLKRDLESPP